jgi:hypothetical protein
MLEDLACLKGDLLAILWQFGNLQLCEYLSNEFRKAGGEAGIKSKGYPINPVTGTSKSNHIGDRWKRFWTVTFDFIAVLLKDLESFFILFFEVFGVIQLT